MNTPLYTALLNYAKASPARFHMPGHKGRPLYGGVWGDLTAIDVTELPQTGDLYREEDGAIREAESLLAKTYNAQHAMFLTDGASQGIFAMLAACTNPGDCVLIDRLCHQSVLHAIVLLDLRPIYIYREISDVIALAVSPEDIPFCDAKAMVITSPTYHGVCSDLKAIHDACKRNGTLLLVDAAHGSHLPFVPGFGDYYHYDSIVMSAHKTLPALGQAAFLFTNGDIRAHRNAAMLVGTSSPSYPIMASIDLARAFLDEQGYTAGERLYNAVTRLKPANVFSCNLLDPLRITAKGSDEIFAAIVPEMRFDDTFTFIISLYDSTEDVERLFNAICKEQSAGFSKTISKMPAAKSAITPRQAMLNSNKVSLSAKDAIGRIAAQPVTPYPPGIPVLMPGEVVEDAHLKYISQILVVN